jgi:hypothetical protein
MNYKTTVFSGPQAQGLLLCWDRDQTRYKNLNEMKQTTKNEQRLAKKLTLNSYEKKKKLVQDPLSSGKLDPDPH